MIYQHVNKRTAMLSLATSHIAHLCNQLNHVALPNFMPRFKSIIFYLNSSEVKVFSQKNAKFSSFAKSGFAPRPPLASSGCGPRPQTPQNSPPHCEFLATRLSMRINIRIACHLIACICLISFFAFTLKKISDVLGVNRLCSFSFRPTA